MLNLFTDYFTTVDGVWIRINTPASHMEMMLYFMYHGQVGYNAGIAAITQSTIIPQSIF